MNFKKFILIFSLLLTNLVLAETDTDTRAINQNCCNPCQLDCTVAGCFTIARCAINTLTPPGCPGTVICADAGDPQLITTPPVIRQCGNNFLVSATPISLDIIGSSGVIVGTPNEYKVTFARPFCSRVAVTVTSSSGSARLASVSTRNDSFIIENALPGDTVCFIAVPVAK